jgi:endonuclease YncB( thermonuclease family)
MNPEPSIITKVHFIKAVDPDTITVEIRRRFNLRLKGIDCYEKNTPEGKAGTQFVDSECSAAKECIAVIPTNDELQLMDIQSFNRIVGDFYYDGKNLKDELDAHNFRKPKGEEHLG